MTTTYAPTFTSDTDELARWDALPDSERSVVLASLWLTLDPATAHARFAAAVGVLALVNEDLATAQELVNHSVERAMAEATDRSVASR